MVRIWNDHEKTCYMNRILSFTALGCATVLLSACGGRSQTDPGEFGAREQAIVRQSDSVMYVLTVFDPADSVILRTPCADFSEDALRSDDFRALADKMLATVQSPQQGGVGIAAPQVGISHRVIVVCRIDKEGEPFEVYPNARIDSLFGGVTHGPEGCLSIPSYRGLVPRREGVVVSYRDPETLACRRDTVQGYTAIIFQHECDHLDGVLYTDRADTVFLNPAWAEERAPYAQAGKYDKPGWLEVLLR